MSEFTPEAFYQLAIGSTSREFNLNKGEFFRRMIAAGFAISNTGVITLTAYPSTPINADNILSGTLPLARLVDITNSQIAAAAAIARPKLNFGSGLVDADMAAGAAIAWSKLSKVGSSLADLVTRSAADLSSGLIPDARIPGLTTDGISRILQLAFAASQSASSDPNTLDDYEEGLFTPIIGGSGGTTGQSYSTQAGAYVKIGKWVYVVATVALSTKGTITTNVQLQGFPFASENIAGRSVSWSVEFENTGTSYASMSALMSPNASVATLRGFAAGGGTSSGTLATADIGTTPTLIFSGMYPAAA